MGPVSPILDNLKKISIDFLKSTLSNFKRYANYKFRIQRSLTIFFMKQAFDYLTLAFDVLKRNETIYRLCDEIRD